MLLLVVEAVAKRGVVDTLLEAPKIVVGGAVIPAPTIPSKAFAKTTVPSSAAEVGSTVDPPLES
jgi:hypothetical protein